jgi:hypothetical protein
MVYYSDIDRLPAVARRAEERPEWRAYAEFCDLRGRGIRKQALERLDRFIAEAATWPFDRRLDFVTWILRESKAFRDRGSCLPQPLLASLIVPTVRSWRENAPEDAEPSLWLGLLRCDNPSRHLEEALELDATCNEARKTLVKWILEDVEVNQHELPAFYINDPRDDLKSLDQAGLLTTGSEDGAWIEATRPAISRLRARAEKWLDAHPREGDFAVSGKKPEAGRLVNWVRGEADRQQLRIVMTII